MRIAVLNNLRAGRNRTNVTRVLNLLRDFPQVSHVETDSARVMPEVLADLTRQEIDLLVINGGDGTLQHALTELLGNPDHDRIPLIAPLRGGRTNMTALDLGAHRDPVKGLELLLRRAYTVGLAGRIVQRPVLRVASDRSPQRHYGMFFGAGMIPRAIRLTHRILPPGRSQGLLGTSLVTAGLIAKTLSRPTEGVLAPDKAQILLDGETVKQGEFHVLIASSLQRLFMGMNPYWGVGPGDVRFTSIATRAHRLKSAALGVLRGRPKPWVDPERGYTSANVHRAQLRFSCGYTVDGEIFDTESDQTVTLTADRRATFVRA